MKSAAAGALVLAFCGTPALAACNISDARLEEAILEKPEFRDPQNRYLVHDLRKLPMRPFFFGITGWKKIASGCWAIFVN
ncbi:hypothetical protein [Agrobacterium vitis]|uniref:hypothetical protein n=1 Tax=Agrobacterium vitis TaxID=373 RepID=UPI002ADE5162|nr:hypothetical protein [Agrobacterium vitis]